MIKIKAFLNTVWHYLTINPIIVIILAALLGVAAAVAVSTITINKLKSKDVSALLSGVTSSIVSQPEAPSEPEIPVVVEQPVEKQVTYKGKQINVVKREVANANSKEDAENGNYIKEQQQPEPQTVKDSSNPYDKTPSSIPYKKPTNGYICGIDVSSHNKEIDWAKVKAAGVEFVMIRCGYRGYLTGKIVTDATFDYNIENAYKNGIDVGVYFYSTAINETEALEEAAYVVELIKNCGEKGIKLKYPVAYDFEEFYNTDTRTRAKDLSAAQISTNTTAFLDYIKSSGYKPMLYAGKNPIKKYWIPSIASKYNFWLAHYTQATEYAGKFFMWQFTSSGEVDGIPGRVDMNICGFENDCNEPQFMICKDDMIPARAKPHPNSSVLLTLTTDTVYLCRNTYDYEYKEIKVDGKYYYVNASELESIPFEKTDYAYKTNEDTVLYTKPFDDTYKTNIILTADTDLEVLGIWQDKWAKTEYEKKVYYIKADKLKKVESDDTSSQTNSSDSSSSDNWGSSDSSSDTDNSSSE